MLLTGILRRKRADNISVSGEYPISRRHLHAEVAPASRKFSLADEQINLLDSNQLANDSISLSCVSFTYARFFKLRLSPYQSFSKNFFFEKNEKIGSTSEHAPF